MNAIAIQNSLLQYPTTVPCSTQRMSTAQTFNALRNQLSHHPQPPHTSPGLQTGDSLTHWSSSNRMPLPSNTFAHPQALTPSVPNSFNELFLADDPQVYSQVHVLFHTQ